MHLSQLLTSLHAIGAVYSCYGTPVVSRSAYKVAEHHPVPQGWTKVGPAPKSAPIHLKVGLKHGNEGVIEQQLLQVSDPNHERYGQHLTIEQIHSIVTPSNYTLDSVQSWLLENGIDSFSYSSAKDWVSMRMTIGQVEDLLQTEYYIFVHDDGTMVVRAPEWSLPVHLHEHIDVVQPTTSFFRPTAAATSLVMDEYGTSVSWGKAHHGKKYAAKTAGAVPKMPISSVCNINHTTPDCWRTLYGTIDYVPQVPEKQKVGICNYLNQTNNRADIALFLARLRPEAVSAAQTFELISVNGGTVSQNYSADDLDNTTGVEGNVDAEMMISMTYPIPMVSWSTAGSPPWKPDLATPTNTNEPHLTWLETVLTKKDLPSVITTSYGDSEQSVPYSYAKRVCEGFAQLGARGISVFFSSGDSGVGAPGVCKSNDGRNITRFKPNFPTACPWVTSVGSTQGFEPETSTRRFASGAGFSNYFCRPDYQKDAVGDYIASLNGLHDGLYNKTGRAYPDVAAQGNHQVMTWNGQFHTTGGTSISVPIFAGIIGLVNDALLAAGKPTLGFLNPWIYSSGHKGLNDIVSGASYGCNTIGFPAQPGWDAVSGWGTPNFTELVRLAMSKDCA